MPWKKCSVLDERLRFVSRPLDREGMSHVRRGFGISRKTGDNIFKRYQYERIEAPSRRLPGRMRRTRRPLLLHLPLYLVFAAPGPWSLNAQRKR